MIELEVMPKRTWRQMLAEGFEGLGAAAGKFALFVLLLILVVPALPLIIYVSILLFTVAGESPMNEREPIEGGK